MIDFNQRHPGPELMDRQDLSKEDLFVNYRELHQINKRLGGYQITQKGLSRLIVDKDRTYTILDIGCGGGDMVNEMMLWGRKNNLELHLTGLDLSKTAIDYAAKNHPQLNWIHANAFDHLNSGAQYDVIMCTLLIHHFTEEKIIELLKLMQKSCLTGIVINDLQRHPLAYYSIRVLTELLSKSYLVRNDAPISVLRGFKKQEWKQMMEKAGISSAVIQWKWAFRYLIVINR
ncbi:MAG: methyltransferase domain-containing protein [Chitinophagales bacterium]